MQNDSSFRFNKSAFCNVWKLNQKCVTDSTLFCAWTFFDIRLFITCWSAIRTTAFFELQVLDEFGSLLQNSSFGEFLSRALRQKLTKSLKACIDRLKQRLLKWALHCKNLPAFCAFHWSLKNWKWWTKVSIIKTHSLFGVSAAYHPACFHLKTLDWRVWIVDWGKICFDPMTHHLNAHCFDRRWTTTDLRFVVDFHCPKFAGPRCLRFWCDCCFAVEKCPDRFECTRFPKVLTVSESWLASCR